MKKLPLILFLLCFAIRILFFILVQPWEPKVNQSVIMKGDAVEYHSIAMNLLNNHELANNESWLSDTLRTPVYPLFLAAVYFLFGPVPWIIIFLQLIIDALSCILLFKIINVMINVRAAFYASLFFILDPSLILHSVNLYSDNLFILFCLLGLHSALPLFQNGSPILKRHTIISILSAGLFFGVAALTRPIGQFLFVPIITIIIILNRHKWKKAVSYSLLFFFIFMVVLIPWMIRNSIKYDAFALSTSSKFNLLILNAAPIEIERRGVQDKLGLHSILLKEADSMMTADGKNPAELNGFQKSDYWYDLALHYISGDPVGFVKHYFIGLFHLFVNLETDDYSHWLSLKQNPSDTYDFYKYSGIKDKVMQFFINKPASQIIIGICIMFYLLICYGSTIIGLIISWGRYNKIFLLLMLSLACYFIFLTGAAGLARFKLPAIPFYLCFTGIGLSYILSIIRKRFLKRIDLGKLFS